MTKERERGTLPKLLKIEIKMRAVPVESDFCCSWALKICLHDELSPKHAYSIHLSILSSGSGGIDSQKTSMPLIPSETLMDDAAVYYQCLEELGSHN